ncbi:MAG: sulfotransferase [Clostridia bacterium]|nr:sulfotransferase [Clostridia bacterium]
MSACEYLIGAGAAKAGTTLLYDLMKDHPALRVGREKEIHYFDRTDSPDRAEYDALFPKGGTRFDVTPIYMYYEDCPEKIASTIGTGGVKIVILLRDPIERARSHYNMSKYQGQEKISFEESFETEAARIAANDHDRRIYSYFSRGLYAKQLDNIYKYFPRENVLVTIFEDFVSNQQRSIDAICDFAGIERIAIRQTASNVGVHQLKIGWIDSVIRTLMRKTPKALKFKPLRSLKHAINKTLAKPVKKQPLDAEFLGKLKDYYIEDVMRLNTVYGLDTSKWRNFEAKG